MPEAAAAVAAGHRSGAGCSRTAPAAPSPRPAGTRRSGRGARSWRRSSPASPAASPDQGARPCAALAAADRERAGAVDHRSRGAGRVTDAYVCRLLPLTCLAPEIVEAILDGRQPKGLRLAEMLGSGPLMNLQRASGASANGTDLLRGVRSRVHTVGSKAETDRRAADSQSACSALCTEAAVAAGDVGRQGLDKALNRFAIDWCGARLGPSTHGGR